MDTSWSQFQWVPSPILFLYHSLITIITYSHLFKIFLMFIYFSQRERDRARVGEGQRERETESEMGSRLWAVNTEPHSGLKLTDHEIMIWAEVSHSTDWATRAPHSHLFKLRVLEICLTASMSFAFFYLKYHPCFFRFCLAPLKFNLNIISSWIIFLFKFLFCLPIALWSYPYHITYHTVLTKLIYLPSPVRQWVLWGTAVLFVFEHPPPSLVSYI